MENNHNIYISIAEVLSSGSITRSTLGDIVRANTTQFYAYIIEADLFEAYGSGNPENESHEKIENQYMEVYSDRVASAFAGGHFLKADYLKTESRYCEETWEGFYYLVRSPESVNFESLFILKEIVTTSMQTRANKRLKKITSWGDKLVLDNVRFDLNLYQQVVLQEMYNRCEQKTEGLSNPEAHSILTDRLGDKFNLQGKADISTLFRNPKPHRLIEKIKDTDAYTLSDIFFEPSN